MESTHTFVYIRLPDFLQILIGKPMDYGYLFTKLQILWYVIILNMGGIRRNKMEKPNYKEGKCCCNCMYSFYDRYDGIRYCRYPETSFPNDFIFYKDEKWMRDNAILEVFVCDNFEYE